MANGGDAGGEAVGNAREATVDSRAGAVSSVDRAISILQVLARHGSARVTDIAAELGVHKSTVSRLLATLEARGLVEQNTTRGSYLLGGGVVQLAAGATRRHDVSVAARPECADLAEAVGETSTVTIHDGTAVLSIEQVIGSQVVTSVNWIGRRSPLHATSSGKLFLAFLSPDERDELLAGELTAYTEHTLTDRDRLLADLAAIRECGYSVATQEQELGLTAVSAPIRDIDGRIVAAITISGPSFRLTPQRVEEVAPLVQAAATRVSERSGQPKKG